MDHGSTQYFELKKPHSYFKLRYERNNKGNILAIHKDNDEN